MSIIFDNLGVIGIAFLVLIAIGVFSGGSSEHAKAQEKNMGRIKDELGYSETPDVNTNVKSMGEKVKEGVPGIKNKISGGRGGGGGSAE